MGMPPGTPKNRAGSGLEESKTALKNAQIDQILIKNDVFLAKNVLFNVCILSVLAFGTYDSC